MEKCNCFIRFFYGIFWFGNGFAWKINKDDFLGNVVGELG
jgi:hypothetical protein